MRRRVGEGGGKVSGSRVSGRRGPVFTVVRRPPEPSVNSGGATLIPLLSQGSGHCWRGGRGGGRHRFICPVTLSALKARQRALLLRLTITTCGMENGSSQAKPPATLEMEDFFFTVYSGNPENNLFLPLYLKCRYHLFPIDIHSVRYLLLFLFLLLL